MAPVTWRFEGRVEAPPHAVYEWMTDFRDDDHRSAAFKRGAGVKPGKEKPSGRTIVSRDGNTVVLESAWGRSKFRNTVTVDPGAREVVIAGDFGYRSTWRAVPHGGGTRVEVEGVMAPTGLFKLMLPLFAKKFVQQTRDDFNGHLEDMRESLQQHART